MFNVRSWLDKKTKNLFEYILMYSYTIAYIIQGIRIILIDNKYYIEKQVQPFSIQFRYTLFYPISESEN